MLVAKYSHPVRTSAASLPAAFVIGLALVCAPSSSRGDDVNFTSEQIRFFEEDVKPILQSTCWKCHSGEKARGNLRLTSRAEALAGGDLGPAVDLKQPLESRLLKAIGYQDQLQMPPSGKLPQKERDILTKWVAAGLPFSPTMQAAPVKQAALPRGGVVTEEAKKYWAYQPVRKPEPPVVKNKAWVRSPIDAFILAKLEAKGLTPAQPAGPTVILRRLYYDLIGLPPTPQEVDEFVKESSVDPEAAYQKTVERLLASPHYGEKWGRHWLDLVRYAETNGYERDADKPHVWRFRDYIINSFNSDKPYDRLIKEMLAGDEIDRDDPECVVATGYYRLGLFDDEPADRMQARFDELDDWVATTGQVFLGMTMNCARCHEHKIDPIPHADYYRLLAFFQDVGRYDPRSEPNSAGITDITPPARRRQYENELAQRQLELGKITGRMTEIENDAIKLMPAEDQRAAEGSGRADVLVKVPRFLKEPQLGEYNQLRKQANELRKKPEPPRELALSVNNCAVRPPATTVQIRGNPHSPGASVQPGFPTVLGFPEPKIPEPAKGAKTSGRRLALANWIASPENPLTARVICNRIWQHHFGRGIVATPNDFGKFGEMPTHPELLDYLASRFMADGWSFKRMHKAILLSSTYRMSSESNPSGLSQDPANLLLWRFNMRRLTAEEIRDSCLAVSGQLNPQMGGPSMYPKIPAEVLAGQSMPGQGWWHSQRHDEVRRSIYIHLKRSLLVPILSQFDQADTDTSCPIRYTTTVPTQALGMLNGGFSNEQALALAERLRREAPGNLEQQVRLAIRLTTSRQPLDAEIQKDAAFVHRQCDKHKLNEFDALQRYCLLILSANEFVYLD